MAPFAARHIGPSPDNVAKMLATVGYGSVDEMMDVAIPEPIRFHGRLALPDAATEAEVIAELRAIASRNKASGFHDRPRLLRHAHAAGDPPQRPRRPVLVHGVHAVQAGDQSGRGYDGIHAGR